MQAAPDPAAVLVPLFEDADGVVRVMLTERSSNLSTHRGEHSDCRAKCHSSQDTVNANKPLCLIKAVLVFL